MSEDESRERMSVAEAAVALGVTRDAIHKRIRRDSIEHEKGEDGRLYVYVDTSTTRLDDSVDESKDTSKVESLERLIRSQQERIEDLREQLSSEREANRENRRIIAGLTSRIPQLEAPRESQESAQEPPEGEARVEDRGEGASGPLWHSTDAAPEEPPRRSWWRRMFGS